VGKFGKTKDGERISDGVSPRRNFPTGFGGDSENPPVAVHCHSLVAVGVVKYNSSMGFDSSKLSSQICRKIGCRAWMSLRAPVRQIEWWILKMCRTAGTRRYLRHPGTSCRDYGVGPSSSEGIVASPGEIHIVTTCDGDRYRQSSRDERIIGLMGEPWITHL
jgi:hypothetical protein